jgi:hypothetical protein
MLTVIRNLREIAERVRQGDPLPADLAAWLERSLREFLDHRCHSVDEALGLRFPKGGVPWWLEEGMRVRDAALRALAERHLAAESTSARAIRVAAMSARFAAANWTVDRAQFGMPERYRGTPKEYLWLAFKSGATMPLGERRLRSILGGGSAAGRRSGCDPGALPAAAPPAARPGSPESRLTSLLSPDK